MTWLQNFKAAKLYLLLIIAFQQSCKVNTTIVKCFCSFLSQKIFHNVTIEGKILKIMLLVVVSVCGLRRLFSQIMWAQAQISTKNFYPCAFACITIDSYFNYSIQGSMFQCCSIQIFSNCTWILWRIQSSRLPKQSLSSHSCRTRLWRFSVWMIISLINMGLCTSGNLQFTSGMPFCRKRR